MKDLGNNKIVMHIQNYSTEIHMQQHLNTF